MNPTPDNNTIQQLQYPLSYTDIQILKEALGSSFYPIGSLYISVLSTDPSTVLGFGTWSAFAAGYALVGYKASDPDFGTVEGTVGEKTHTLSTAEVPSSTPAIYVGNTGSGHSSLTGTGSTTNPATTAYADPVGGGGAHNNIQPSITVYMWKRTA